jgi:DNA-binding MarR family transcriptional regulator
MSTSNNSKLAAGMAKIGLVLRQHAWKVGTESGLTPTQSQVVALLHSRGAEAGLAMSEVAGELALTPATVSDSVAALERKGLVSRGRDGRDGRVVRVGLTARGASRARRSVLWPDMLLSAIDTLGPEEQAVFVRGLVKMIYSLQQSGQVPMARMCPTCTYFRPHVHRGESRPHHCAYVDAPLAEVDLRLDCAEHDGASPADVPRLWGLFVNGEPPAETARAGGVALRSSGRPCIDKEN